MPAKRRRILLVDDDPDILESLAALLSDTYEVRLARDGREALDLLEREPLDAVILDMMMPVLSGEGVLQELARRGLQVPVIVVSARLDAQQRARALGAAHWLPKPFPVSHLEETLARLFAAA